MQNTSAAIRPLGKLAVEPALLARVLKTGFPVGSFENAINPPDAFVNYLQNEGYRTDTREPCLLFASMHGVGMHTDGQLTALWTLAAPESAQGEIELIVGSEFVKLRASEVLLFDATKYHGVIASTPGLWCIVSAYVKPLTL